ncbi:mycofactocin-coupled SDR family oxidoreductase [Pseudonocardia yuanmonensis]|uniref:Mycofactocin-coupled SDR family oxidoreductase n=1 Tax=Pseudonocardia yuanmonensis TaxID=1095914 RepID=A0ABP8WCX6_9PSEU
MGRLDGKVALITGAARGQGRSHAITLAREGAEIIAVDLAGQVESVPYEMATPADLAQTVKLVEAEDRRIVSLEADVRDPEAMQAATERGLAEFGHIDIICANAGISSWDPAPDMSPQRWRDMIDINLSGVWYSVQPALTSMIERGAGGSIILTSSVYGLEGGVGRVHHYVAAKHGVVGLAKSLANELAPHRIRVNTVNPTFVATGMIQNDAIYKLFVPDLPNPTQEDFKEVLLGMNKLPIPWVEPQDISNAVLFLASDDARYITGTTLVVDAGHLA